MKPQSGFGDTLVIEPLSKTHKQTFILLHGRGSSASIFGPEFVQTSFQSAPNPLTGPPTTSTLATTFPHAKFIFPTAPRRRATIYKRSIINQWFDSWHMDSDNPHAQEWLMIEGLQETVAYVHDLLRKEIALVGKDARRVILGGISQGCAASLVALLLWDGPPLGGVLGMCGWLPFRKRLGRRTVGAGGEGGASGFLGDLRRGSVTGDTACVGDTSDEDSDSDSDLSNDEDGPVLDGAVRWADCDKDDFDPFERSDNDDESSGATGIQPLDSAAHAVQTLREALEMDLDQGKPPSSFVDTPVFLGHGTDDEKVPVTLGAQSAACLDAMGVKVSWHEYHGLGHWYSPEMIAQMVDFVNDQEEFGKG